MLKDLLNKKKKLSVTGLGYVGLPLALEFARHFSVIGFDINDARIQMMKNQVDPSNELESSAFEGCDIQFTSNFEDLKDAHFHIIGVPTDIDQYKVPNLKPLLSASESVGKILKKGDVVVYESTVYPGCTEEDCLPILEKHSGLSGFQDFQIAYSPERINPGDKKHTLTKITKVVAGNTSAVTDMVSDVYGQILEAGVYKASSIRVAEAAKVIENTQRDINIALMNELAMIFDKMDIDTNEVLAAAGSKWNFLKFYPGLVGGHCIGVDPYYLTYKAQKMGYLPSMILSGRKTNETIPEFLAKRLVQFLIKAGKNPGDCKVLIKGLTFKENVTDIRNTKVTDVIKELENYYIDVEIEDPWAKKDEVQHEYGLNLTENPVGPFDAVIVAVAHNEFKDHDAIYFKNIMKEDPILFDLKGIYDFSSVNDMKIWRL